MTRLAVLDDYHRRAHEYADWDSLGPAVEVSFFHEPMDEETLVRTLQDFEMLSLMRERTAFPRRVLERLPNLRFIVTTGVRNASVDVESLNACGVVMSGTDLSGREDRIGVTGPIEIVWSMILAFVKRTLSEDRAMREGVWQSEMPGILGGTTLGLAGLGRLGSAMVEPARAFGMRVIVWSENLTVERTSAFGVEKVSKEALFSESDVLSIHLVLSDRTRGLIGAPELALMKTSVYLINTARGPIVDEAALIEALRTKAIAGAGLDVYDKEPLPAGHPFLALDNTILAPHLGYVSEKNFRVNYEQVVEAIAAYLKGEPIRVIK